MSEETWPEQDAVDEWIKHHNLDISNEQAMQLKISVTQYRLDTQKRAAEQNSALSDVLEALCPFAEAFDREKEIHISEKHQAEFDANIITPQVTVGDFRKASEAYWGAKGKQPYRL